MADGRFQQEKSIGVRVPDITMRLTRRWSIPTSTEITKTVPADGKPDGENCRTVEYFNRFVVSKKSGGNGAGVFEIGEI